MTRCSWNETRGSKKRGQGAANLECSRMMYVMFESKLDAVVVIEVVMIKMGGRVFRSFSLKELTKSE